MNDFFVENHGSIFLLRPLSKAAREWVSENLPDDALWHCGAAVVEHRYIAPIVEGLIAAGYQVTS